jgi:F420-non-reducing hydrogenase iron-sulfur subunit
MGIPVDRMRLEWVSASEGKQFAELVNEMTETVRDLGPAGIKPVLDKLAV